MPESFSGSLGDLLDTRFSGRQSDFLGARVISGHWGDVLLAGVCLVFSVVNIMVGR